MSGELLDAIAGQAAAHPLRLAVAGDHVSLSYGALADEIGRLAERLAALGCSRIGILMDNGPVWLALDLAAETVGCVRVPLPAFFSDAQLGYALQNAGVDCLITDQSQRIGALGEGLSARPIPGVGRAGLWSYMRPSRPQPQLPRGTAKITYTSGTTGSPKGVCLSQESMDSTARVLAEAAHIGGRDRHLGLLPLSLLLQNLAGAQAHLLNGASVVLSSLPRVGMQGASGIDRDRLARALRDHRPTTLILVPQLLQVMLELVEEGLRLPWLRFVAVGGAPVSPQLLEHAARLGLPVYEGYGLSECASVVALNTPVEARIGSVGRPLPHIRLVLSADGEIEVTGNRFLGYLGEPATAAGGPVQTGDLGFMDPDGFLYLLGRRNSVFVTSFGRNVAPEWVERELLAQPVIGQAVVFGNAKPWSTAVISAGDVDPAEVHAALESANRRLPDYAHVRAWIRADEPFSFFNQQLTANGRPRREAIWAHYGRRIEQIYLDASTTGTTP
jgi:long-chain acyl-CoA synthetase